MPATKSIADTVSKWQARSGVATNDYAQGVSAGNVDWAGPAAAASDTWSTAVQEAIGRNAFANGVQRVGNQRWQQRARDVGAQRFAPGVAASVDRFRESMTPVLATIQSVQLPPRGPRGSAGNLQRVQVIADALHQARLQRG